MELIDTRDALARLAPEWNPLLEESEAPNVFLTWEWISAWVDTLGKSCVPAVVTARDASGRLCGLAPFHRTSFRLLGAVRYAALCVLADQLTGLEYGDLMLRRDVKRAAGRAILRRLAQERRRWDVLWLRGMGPSTAPCDRLIELSHAEGLLARSRATHFSRIELPSSFDDYLQGLPKRERYQMRTGLQRIQSEHQAKLVSCETPSQLDERLDDLFRLHQQRWGARGEPGIFACPVRRAFFQKLAERMLARGWLRLDTLHVRGRAVAAQIGFAYRGVMYALQRGFDTSFPNVRGGLGTALRSMVIRRSIEEGIHTYDFLGGFTDAKRRAGARECWGNDLLVFRPSLRNKLLFRSRTWPTGRYLRRVTPADPANPETNGGGRR